MTYRTDNRTGPHCLICGQRMIKELYGDHFRCIYPHVPRVTKYLKAAALLFFISALIVAACFLTGCTTTITPKVPKAAQASFDGNEQNSGYLGKDALGFRIITAHARDRYNALVEIYGREFQPPVKIDDGVTRNPNLPGTFRIDAEHTVKFATMNRWKKAGRPAL